MERKSNNKNRKNKVGNRKAGSRVSKKSEKVLELSLIRTYPHQVCWEVWLPAQPFKLTTTVTTGLIANAFGVLRTQVESFSTRFGSTFVEYRIVRALFKIRLFSSTNPGVLQVWLDEQSTNTPSVAEAQERAVLIVSASSTDKNPQLKWTAADPNDLKYTAIGSNVTPVTFKVYTDNANFGASIVATDYCEVEPYFQFQFRGLMGV